MDIRMSKYLKILLFSLVAFMGCEDDKASESDPVSPFVGTWSLASVSFTLYTNPAQTVTYTANGESTYETLIMTESGTYSYQGAIDGDMLSGSGTWSSTDDILTLVEDGATTLWTYSMTNDDNWSCYVETPENDDYYGRRTEYSWTRAD